MRFDHVEDTNLKELLTQGWDGDEDVICQALTLSEQCVSEDAHNQLLDTRIVDARAAALEEAEHCWNELGDGHAAVESLRKLWEV